MAKVTYTSTVQLGDRVEHRITKFRGIVQCVTFWLNGCARVSVLPEKLDKEGKVKETMTFDDMELEVLKHAAVPSAVGRDEDVALPGGPRPEPARRRDPNTARRDRR